MGWLVTRRPALAAAAVAFGIVVSPLVALAPAVAQTPPGQPTEVAIVVAITVPESETGLIDAAELENYTSEFGLLTRELDHVIDRPVTLAIDPRIIASIRILGSSAPESAVAWLDRLDAATNETFALGWADSDLTLGLEAGSGSVLSPESLDFAIDPALFGAAVPEADPSATPTAAPTQDPTDDSPPPLATTESLLAWDYTLPSVAWPEAGTVSTGTLATLTSTFDSTLLASANLTGLSGLNSTATVNGAGTLVIDSPLSTLFSTTVASAPGANFDTAVASLGIAMTSAATAPGASSAIITLDRDVALSSTNVAATLDAIALNPAVQLVGLSAVADNAAGTATLVDMPQDPTAVAAVAGLLEQEELDREFSQIAETPSLITSERRLSLLATLSNQWDSNPAGWVTAIDDYRAASTDLRSSVAIIKSSSITLLSDRGSLPVTVSNDLDQPVTVYITVRPLTPLLRVENSRVELTVEPNSQRKAQIPVQSISNGVVELEISLHGAAAQQIGYTTYVRTTVQAGWETPFTVVVAIVVFLVFAVGIVRTVLRRRRLRTEREIGA